MVNPFDQTLIGICRSLDDGGIPYMIIGGYAVSVHAAPRMTEDIDVTLGVDKDAFPVVTAAVVNDFDFVLPNPREFAESTNVVLLRDKATGVRVDLIFSFIPFERTAIQESIIVTIADYPVKVVSAENLIIYKLLSGRPKDIEDAENIYLCNRGNLDRDTISGRLEDLSQALDAQSMDAWRRLLRG